MAELSEDIYIAMVSSTHNVCAKDVYVAIVSTIVETSAPENEIQLGLSLLGPLIDKYVRSAIIHAPFTDIICFQIRFRHALVRAHV